MDLGDEGVGAQQDPATARPADGYLVSQGELDPLLFRRGDHDQPLRADPSTWRPRNGNRSGNRNRSHRARRCRAEGSGLGLAQLYPHGAQDPEEEEVQHGEEDVLEESENRIGHWPVVALYPRPNRIVVAPRVIWSPSWRTLCGGQRYAVDFRAVGASHVRNLVIAASRAVGAGRRAPRSRAHLGVIAAHVRVGQDQATVREAPDREGPGAQLARASHPEAADGPWAVHSARTISPETRTIPASQLLVGLHMHRHGSEEHVPLDVGVVFGHSDQFVDQLVLDRGEPGPVALR